MQITQELINRFFKNECSAEEVDFVVKYFSENEDAVENNISKTEWDNIDTEVGLNAEQSKKLLSSLKKQLFPKQNASLFLIHRIPLKAIVAAASVVLLILSGWLFTSGKNEATNTAAIKREKPLIDNNAGERNWRVVKNTENKKLVIALEDGSVITLFKNSVVQYPNPFTGNVREIELNGDAFFEVAKNKQRPFIVYSGNLSTTALGTSFRITAFDEGRSSVNVKLMTGKVVVKSISEMPDWKKDHFLLQGEQLTYNAQTATVVVTKFLPEKKTASNISRITQNKHVVKELQFNNTALNEVINQLAALYNVKISFSDADLQGMNFTGTVNEYDDLKAILKMIGQMNELQVDQTQEGFSLVSPKKQ
jgi:transmembrane sensor